MPSYMSPVSPESAVDEHIPKRQPLTSMTPSRSFKTKQHRSHSLPAVHGNFVLLNRGVKRPFSSECDGYAKN